MRSTFALYTLFFLALLPASMAFAQSGNLDKSSQEALTQTQQMLRDKQQRENALKQNPQALEQHKKVQQLTGGNEKNTDAMYGISADIMSNLTNEANGDPKKMQEILLKAHQDPKAFYEKLTPEQKAQIKALSESISPQPQLNSAPGRQ